MKKKMKAKAFLITLVFCLAASSVWAGQLTISATDIDYGVLKEGPPVLKTVTLTNIGSTILDIANVKTS